MVQKTDNLSSQFPDIEGTVAQCSLPNAISFTLNLASTALRIRVALPLNEQIETTSNNPAANIHRYPVLYLLDANASFASVVETNRRLSRRPDATRVAPAIIVGIDGDSGTLYDTELRKQLYSDIADPATSSESQPAPLAEINAEKFLGFIKTELFPLIQRLFPTDPQQQYLLGHSLAGYFTTWVLANHPGTFQGYAAISPSLWQNPDTLNALTSGTWQQQNANEENAEPASTKEVSGKLPRVFLAVGEWEESLAPWQHGHPKADEIAQRRQARGMVSNVLALGEALSTQLGEEQVQYAVYPGEDHASVFGTTLGRAMRHLLIPDITPVKTPEN